MSAVAEVYSSLAFDNLAYRELMAKIEAGEGVVEDFGRRVLDEIRQEYGTFEAYLEREFGLIEERLAALRNMYLE